MRMILLAQGSGRRWCDADGTPYLGRPKQLIEIGGETLLARAVRLFAERGCEVIVVGPDDDRFRHPSATLVTLDDPWPWPNDMSKFVGTRELWADDGRTVIGWADCWYSQEAADLIVGHGSDELHYFRRPAGSTMTGCRWDESFAVSFGPGEHARVMALAEQVHQAWQAGALRQRDGGHIPVRNHQAAALGVPYDRRRLLIDAPNQTVIDDWSDDIDSPADYAMWVGRHERPNVAFCVPWFGGDQHRTAAWEHTRAWFEQIGVPIYVGDDDSGGEWTNRARGCNNAARAALADGYDVLLIGDADVLLTSEAVFASAHAAQMTGQMVIAYRDYHRLSVHASHAVYRGAHPAEQTAEKVWWKHVSGGVAVTADLWDRVGGFDERFDSWGGEDRSFWMAGFVLGGGWHRIHQPAWHLWHPRSPERDSSHPNKANVVELGRRYKRASGWLSSGGTLGALADTDTDPDIDALLALMSEPGGPLAKETADAAT